MNIFKHEFKAHLQSVITWSLSIALLIYVFSSFFTAIADDAAVLNEMMANFPQELLIAFGMDNIDMSSVLGFYGLVFLFCQICLAVQAANYGFSLVSVEERELTADFLLAKPVSRVQILTIKFLSALTGLTITNAVVWIATFAFLELNRGDRTYEAKPLLMVLGSIVVFQLVFMTLGLLISLLVKRVRSVTPFAMGLALGMYVLSAFGGMLGDVKLELITPFKHFDANQIINHSAYDPMALISVGAIVISIVGSYILYTRRDMPAAV